MGELGGMSSADRGFEPRGPGMGPGSTGGAEPLPLPNIEQEPGIGEGPFIGGRRSSSQPGESIYSEPLDVEDEIGTTWWSASAGSEPPHEPKPPQPEEPAAATPVPESTWGEASETAAEPTPNVPDSEPVDTPNDDESDGVIKFIDPGGPDELPTDESEPVPDASDAPDTEPNDESGETMTLIKVTSLDEGNVSTEAAAERDADTKSEESVAPDMTEGTAEGPAETAQEQDTAETASERPIESDIGTAALAGSETVVEPDEITSEPDPGQEQSSELVAAELEETHSTDLEVIDAEVVDDSRGPEFTSEQGDAGLAEVAPDASVESTDEVLEGEIVEPDVQLPKLAVEPEDRGNIEPVDPDEYVPTDEDLDAAMADIDAMDKSKKDITGEYGDEEYKGLASPYGVTDAELREGPDMTEELPEELREAPVPVDELATEADADTPQSDAESMETTEITSEAELAEADAADGQYTDGVDEGPEGELVGEAASTEETAAEQALEGDDDYLVTAAMEQQESTDENELTAAGASADAPDMDSAIVAARNASEPVEVVMAATSKEEAASEQQNEQTPQETPESVMQRMRNGEYEPKTTPMTHRELRQARKEAREAKRQAAAERLAKPYMVTEKGDIIKGDGRIPETYEKLKQPWRAMFRTAFAGLALGETVANAAKNQRLDFKVERDDFNPLKYKIVTRVRGHATTTTVWAPNAWMAKRIAAIKLAL